LTMHNGIKPVLAIGSVVHSTDAAVGLNDTVATLNPVSISRLLVAFRVTGLCIINTVGVAVLWVGVILGVNGGLSDQRGLGGEHSRGHNGSDGSGGVSLDSVGVPGDGRCVGVGRRCGICNGGSYDAALDRHHAVGQGRSSGHSGDKGSDDEQLRTITLVSLHKSKL